MNTIIAVYAIIASLNISYSILASYGTVDLEAPYLQLLEEKAK